ncbi:MAG: RHS repeat-associated core domain-containing protein [Lysobacterales bacterium]
MTDANGNTVTRTTFDAWGNIEQQIAGGAVQTSWQLPNYNPDQTGQAALLTNDGQLIGFTGYQKDSDTGLYYAGARWYDALTGSFNGMDPAQGNPNSPVSLHRYLYANGNPLIYIDPDGEFAFLQRLADRFGQVATNAQGAANDLNGQLNGSVLGDSFTRLKGIALGVGIKGVAVLGEGLVRTTNFVANSASRQFISDQSELGRQLDGELDASFQSLDAGVGQGVALAQKVAADPSQGLALAKAGAQGAGRQLSRTFIEGDTGAAAETFSGLPGVLLAPATAGFGGRLLGKAGEALSDLGGKARAKLPRPSVGAPEIGPRDIDFDLDGGIDRSGLPSLARAADATPVPTNAIGGGTGAATGVRGTELSSGGVGVTPNRNIICGSGGPCSVYEIAADELIAEFPYIGKTRRSVPKRMTDKDHRRKTASGQPPRAEVLAENLTPDEAAGLEALLVNERGLDRLSNAIPPLNVNLSKNSARIEAAKKLLEKASRTEGGQ